MPERIQLRRTKGWRLPAGAISVARPSRWGNPYVVGAGPITYHGPVGGDVGFYGQRSSWADLGIPGAGLSAQQAVGLYRDELEASLADPGVYFVELREAFERLCGHDLACWCPLVDEHGEPVPCHAAVLLGLANR